jgi:hypothetical protein
MALCPDCGAPARAVSAVSITGPQCEDDYFADLFECPNGHGEVTEDGLLLKQVTALDASAIVCQVGKGGFVRCLSRSFFVRTTA